MEVRARKLGDESFMNAPAAERVAFWRSFEQTYPDVPLGDEYSQALTEYEMELEAKSAAAAASTPPAAQEEHVYQDPFGYSGETYYRTYGNHVGWYGYPVDPVLVRQPTRSYAHKQPSYGYGYQDAIEVPPRPQRPVHPTPRPRPLPARER